MVFSQLHWIPSALAALLTFMLAFNTHGKLHRALSVSMILLALLGFAGYISSRNLRFFPLDLHTLHSWIGLFPLTLSILLFNDKMLLHKAQLEKHCLLGKLTGWAHTYNGADDAFRIGINRT